ncbi:putative efflux pump antibiotic resistance protein [Mycena olivaceomarginata]|nr:putative efflux pump antibiotic resistance protein [Mycena olivaceomarginata]
MSHYTPHTEATPNGSSLSVTRVASNEREKSEQQATTEVEKEKVFPHGLKLVVLMVALCLAFFFVALYSSIIATAIPKITEQFKSLADVGWAISATQLLFRKFYTLFPVKSVFFAAISLFELGSLICGVAPTSKALIIGRAIAGLGSAGIFTGALITHAVPLAKRPMYTGLVGAMYGIANVAGPLMGGAFTDKVSWRWYLNNHVVNLPIGGVTIFIIAFILKVPKSAEHKAPETPLTLRQRVEWFDPCLPLALQWGGSKYAWDNGRIIALFVLFRILITAFVGIQIWQQENATVPPRILMRRSIWAGGWFSLALGASFFVFVYYLPICDNLPMLLALVLSSITSGILITLFGYYIPAIWLSTAKWIGYQVLCGFGLGCGTQAPVMAAQTVLKLKDIFMQTLGGALFISVAQNLIFAGATNLKRAMDPQLLPAVLEVYNAALASAFQVGVAMAGVSIVGALAMEWKSVKGKNGEMAAA